MPGYSRYDDKGKRTFGSDTRQIDPKTLEPIEMGPLDSGQTTQPTVVPVPQPAPSSEMSPEAQALERDYDRRMLLKKQQGKQ